MTRRLSPWNLGASLYMPATRTDITDAIIRNKISGLRSLIICLEDAVSEADIPQALNNLQGILAALTAENSVPETRTGRWCLSARVTRKWDCGCASTAISVPLTGWYCRNSHKRRCRSGGRWFRIPRCV